MSSKRIHSGQIVYKSYRRTFESYINQNNVADITKKLQVKGFFTTKEVGVLTVPNLKAVIREQIESSDGEEKFLILLDVYETFVDVTTIREVFLKGQQGKTIKRRASVDVPTTTVAKKPPIKVHSKKGESAPSQRKFGPQQKLSEKRLKGSNFPKNFSDSVLSTIPGSPSTAPKHPTSLEEANNRNENTLSATQSEQGATVAQETNITHIQYPKNQSETFQFESDSGIHEEVQHIEVLQQEYTDELHKMTNDLIASIFGTFKGRMPGLHSKYETLVNRCTKLEETVQQYEHSSKVQEMKMSEECQLNATLKKELEQKDEEIQIATAKIEKLKEEKEKIQLRMAQPQNEHEEIKFSQGILKEIHKILSQVEDPREQYKLIEALHVIQRELFKLQSRPATTGRLRGKYH